MNGRMLVVAALAAVWSAGGAERPWMDAARPVSERVESLLREMTVEEKAGQLHQDFAKVPSHPVEALTNAVRRGRVGSFINCYRDERRVADKAASEIRRCHDALQRVAVEESRLGIPLVFGHDVVHGCYTTFPIPLALACAFEPELFERSEAVAAREARWRGYEWAFSPMCDTARDPRWGRVAETCGEDPYLNALCVAAHVRGLQGDDIGAPDRVAACLKHFVGYSDVIGGRDYNQTECSEWTLRNLHLVPFRAGIAAGAATVMSSFNTVEGLPACASRHALTDVLRGEWGFKGFVVSDWNAVQELVSWGLAPDGATAVLRALSAGNDMEMVSTNGLAAIPAAIADGRLDSSVLDEAVRRVLTVKFRLGLFERPYAVPVPGVAEQSAWFDAAQALAFECARKSAVLLKNEGALPLAAKRVALIGPLARDRGHQLGCWSARGELCRRRLCDTLPAALGPTVTVETVAGCAVNTVKTAHTDEDGKVVRDPNAEKTNALETDAVKAAVARADVVVVALCEDVNWSGENHSCCTLGLSGRQQELFDLVVAQGKPVVAVIASGCPLALPSVWEKSAAVLWASHLGCGGPAAIADLLAGKASPEGHLSVSLPRDVSQVPVYYNAAVTGRPDQGRYVDAERQDAAYPFGYGLTYTTFDYSPTVVTGGVARCTVRNAGARTGVATAQLYVRQHACAEGVRPARELRGFRKVTLGPGESAEVSFALDAATLGYTDRRGFLCCDAGAYSAVIAPDSASGVPTRFSFVGNGGR